MEDKTDYEKLKKPNLLKEYLLLKTDPLQFLFEGKGQLFVFAEKDGKVIEFDVQVRCHGDAKYPWDCKIGNFDLNMFVRTDKGANGEKYDTLKLMLKDVAKELLKEPIRAAVKYYRIVTDKNIGRNE